MPKLFLNRLLALAVLAAAASLQARVEIVGGHSISIKDAPWQMAFLVDEGGGTTQYCGAVWIGERWALTAAHCVENATTANASVFAGITRRTEMRSANKIGVDQILPHPDFPRLWKDIAILHLAADVTSTLAKPIRYANLADARAGLTDPGVTVFATGWGKLTASATGLPDSLYGVTCLMQDTTKYVVRWAGLGGTTDIGSCQGDSGGPLVVHDSTGVNWILAGLSSTISSFCGDPNSPSNYTRVSSFATWIQQNTGLTFATSAHPADASVPTLAFIRPTRLRLTHAQNLEMTLVDFSGATLLQSKGFYPQGEFSAPSIPGAGAYVLRIRGEAADLRETLRALP